MSQNRTGRKAKDEQVDFSQFRAGQRDRERRGECLGFFQSKALSVALARIPESLFRESCVSLEHRATPTATERTLKTRFWRLVAEGAVNNRRFKLRALYSGIVSYQHFYDEILSNPTKVAWLIASESSSSHEIGRIQVKAIENVNYMVGQPVIDSRGDLIVSAANRVLRAFEFLIMLAPRAIDAAES